ncbi:uncharacterized protein [Argopecten irradians]|uniref:uncharacterized protein n=1 Tax=Argopecten irradians TaxID=31199 RepID=UPI00371BB416
MADVSTSSELLWDHAGEDLEENPLINTYRTDSPARRRIHRPELLDNEHDGVHLSYYQTVKLLENLEESSETLKQYLGDLNNTTQNLSDRGTTQATNNTLRARFCRKCLKGLEQTTGTKTIIFTVLLQGVNLLIQTIIDIWSKKDDDNALIVVSMIH